MSHGAKMAEFAGWNMPIQYPTGIIAEHTHTRQQAGLFDICHMGEFLLDGKGAAEALARAVTVNIATLKPGRCRYGFLLNEKGGILDDLIVYRLGDERFMIVVNAGCRALDLATLRDVGLAIVPADAHHWVQPAAHWVTPRRAGHGAARDACDLLLYAQGRVDAILEHGEHP